MAMHAIEGIDVPAGGEAVLKPGGYHIMLINLAREPREGESISVTLVFAQAGELEVLFQVRNP
jgi:copper(I)-binding protein